MAININIEPSEEIEAQEQPKQPPVPQIEANIRKTLDGKLMILDHNQIDIIIDTKMKKVMTFPKDNISDEIYDVQNNYFKYMGKYPEAVDDNINENQVVVFSTSKFIDIERPKFETQQFIEDEIEDNYVDPTPEDSTELGEVPQEPKKGSITPYRIRRYLSGYGYYE
jgi:hypothetical protein